MGIARLGALVNFISHTVVVGFTAGAGLLIVAAQLKNFFGVPIPSGARFFDALGRFAQRLAECDPWITATGTVTVVVAIATKRWLPRLPYMVVAMVAGSLFGYALARAGIAQVPVVGALPSGVTTFSLPSSDPETWRRIFPAALALTVLQGRYHCSDGRN